jgi:hypothetical protein
MAGKSGTALRKSSLFSREQEIKTTKEGQQVTRATSYSTILDFEAKRIISPRSSQSDQKANII